MSLRPQATSPHGGMDKVRLFLAVAPLVIFAVTCWLVKPLSVGGNIALSYMVPFGFCFSVVFFAINKQVFLRQLSKVRLEFFLLFVLVALCFLSLLNSSIPFRSFRTLFPCMLPMLLFLQLVVVWQVSPKAVHFLPKIFIACGILFSSVPLLVTLAVPSLLPHMQSSNRYCGFFENSNQHSIVLATLLPLTITEFSVARGRLKKFIWSILLILLIYTQIRSGAKTALVVGLGASWLFYILIHFRSSTPFKRFAMTFGMLLLAIFILTFGINIAAAIDPLMASKLQEIVSGGVENYQSIQSRQGLWREAMDMGSQHWVIGAGAGMPVLGVSHAHNLVLDYFKGVGLFGAVSILLLCLLILFRAARKALFMLSSPSGPGDRRIFACYTAACIYVACNQLSDCFGPSTIAALWIVYLPAVFSEHCANKFAGSTVHSSPRPAKYRNRRTTTSGVLAAT